MTTIKRLLAVPAQGAGYVEDLAALHGKATPVSERYTISAITPGFGAVREVAQAVSFGLVLDDDQVVWGDCVSVAYGGKAGRDPVFRAFDGVESIRRAVAPFLKGRRMEQFRELAVELDDLTETVMEKRLLPEPTKGDPFEDKLSRKELLTAPMRILRDAFPEKSEEYEEVEKVRRLPAAVRYGVSQALLRAVAAARRLTMAEVLAEEWGLPIPASAVPIHAQSGRERQVNAEKMIFRRLESLPHGLIDNIPEQLGAAGGEMASYLRWLKARLVELGGADYKPTVHLDVHGALGTISEGNLGKVLGQLYAMECNLGEYDLRVESPILLESRDAQIEAMKKLREYISFRKMKSKLVVDEWANSLEDILAFIDAGAADMIQIKMPVLGSVHNAVDAVLACKNAGVGAFLGGSCSETELSAQVAVHVALASQPDLLMARPGLGVDEALCITSNEMARALAIIRSRRRPAAQ